MAESHIRVEVVLPTSHEATWNTLLPRSRSESKRHLFESSPMSFQDMAFSHIRVEGENRTLVLRTTTTRSTIKLHPPSKHLLTSHALLVF